VQKLPVLAYFDDGVFLFNLPRRANTAASILELLKTPNPYGLLGESPALQRSPLFTDHEAQQLVDAGS
jgi:hypothetical protein